MSRPIRILLVEDNPADADLTKETLETGKLRLELKLAVDGSEAINYLLEQVANSSAELPDLILLDLNLPKKDGRQVLREIRAQELLRRIPVVVLTSSDAEQDILKSYDLGANCYVTKPVGLDAFQSIVRCVENFWFTVVRLP